MFKQLSGSVYPRIIVQTLDKKVDWSMSHNIKDHHHNAIEKSGEVAG